MENKRTVLIVGGTGGIGKYMIEAFSTAGYNVLFTYFHNEETAAEAEKNFNAKGYRTDVTSEKEILDLSAELNKKQKSLDALIYCSGIFLDSMAEGMELESWEQVMAVNLTGAFLCAKYFLKMLRESGHGRFICTGSVMGESGIYGSCSYAASKAGLIGLVKSIALENARYNVTANVLSLGYIDTGMTTQLSEKILKGALQKIPMKRTGNPQDVGRLAVSLCGDYTNYISGQVIRNNGLLYV